MGLAGDGDTGAFAEAPREAPDGKSIEFMLSRSGMDWVIWTLLGVNVFVLAVFFLLTLDAETGFPWGTYIFVAIPFACSLGVALWMRWRARNDSRVHLVISTRGILAPNAVDRVIRWDELKKISFYEHNYKGQRQNVFMTLNTFYPDHFSAKGGNWTRKINRWWYSADVVFPLEALVGEPEDVKAAVARFAPADLLERSGL